MEPKDRIDTIDVELTHGLLTSDRKVVGSRQKNKIPTNEVRIVMY